MNLKFSSQLSKEQIIKSAGVFSGLKHIINSLFSKEYKEKRNLLKDQNSQISDNLRSVENLISAIESSMNEGDVEKYFSQLDQLKHVSNNLLKDISRLTNTVDEIKEQSQSLLTNIDAPSLRYVDQIYFTPKVKDLTKARIVKALSNADIEQSVIDEIFNKDIWGLLEDKLHKGSVIQSHQVAKPSKQRQDRDNEKWVTLSVKPFQIFDYPILMEFTATVTDMYSRKNSNTKWAVKNVGKILVEKTNEIKMAMLKSAQEIPVEATKKKSNEFIRELKAVSSRLGVKPEYLAAIMTSESGMNAGAVNPRGGATGLIQFMPSTAEALGTSTDELEQMSDVEQLKYVEKYFSPFKGKLNSVADLYMATFLPVFVGQPGNTKVGERYNYRSIPRSNLTYHKIYEANNEAFDPEDKGYFTINDCAKRARSFIKNMPKEEIQEEEVDPELTEQSIVDQIKEIYDFFMKSANNKDDILIKQAIKKAIETNKFIVRISKEDNNLAPYKFASDISTIIETALDIDSEIYSDSNNVELEFKCAGTKETATLLIHSILKQASDVFKNIYNENVKYKVILNKESELQKTAYKKVYNNCLKFSLSSDEISYSSMMRKLEGKEKEAFQKSFKEEFDKNLLEDEVDPYEIALEKSIGEI
jgi:hypothetical protein